MNEHAAGEGERGAGQIMGINPSMRRVWLAHNTGHALSAAQQTAFEPEQTRGNIENLVGAAQVPLGVAGPIRINGEHAQGSYYVPFATTDGTLVSTYQYGMRAITEAGGANARVLADSALANGRFIEAHRHGRCARDQVSQAAAVTADSSASAASGDKVAPIIDERSP